MVGAKFACASGGVVTVLVAHIANRGHLHAQHEQRVVSHSKSQAAIAAWRHFGDDDMLEFFCFAIFATGRVGRYFVFNAPDHCPDLRLVSP